MIAEFLDHESALFIIIFIPQGCDGLTGFVLTDLKGPCEIFNRNSLARNKQNSLNSSLQISFFTVQG